MKWRQPARKPLVLTVLLNDLASNKKGVLYFISPCSSALITHRLKVIVFSDVCPFTRRALKRRIDCLEPRRRREDGLRRAGSAVREDPPADAVNVFSPAERTNAQPIGCVTLGCRGEIDGTRTRAVAHHRRDAVVPRALRLVHLAVSDHLGVGRLQNEVELPIL